MRALLLALPLLLVAAAPGPVARQAVVNRAERMFAVADRDHDGWLTRAEYARAVLASARRYDPKIAADAPGMRAPMARFDALAAATGGRLSRDAFVAEATAHFDGADLDHDGTVTPEEARRAQAIRQKAIDAAKRAPAT